MTALSNKYFRRNRAAIIFLLLGPPGSSVALATPEPRGGRGGGRLACGLVFGGCITTLRLTLRMSRRTFQVPMAPRAEVRAAPSAWFAWGRRSRSQTYWIGSGAVRRRPDLCSASRACNGRRNTAHTLRASARLIRNVCLCISFHALTGKRPKLSDPAHGTQRL